MTLHQRTLGLKSSKWTELMSRMLITSSSFSCKRGLLTPISHSFWLLWLNGTAKGHFTHQFYHPEECRESDLKINYASPIVLPQFFSTSPQCKTLKNVQICQKYVNKRRKCFFNMAFKPIFCQIPGAQKSDF